MQNSHLNTGYLIFAPTHIYTVILSESAPPPPMQNLQYTILYSIWNLSKSDP